MSYCIYCTVCTNVSKIKAIHLLICKREISAISASLSQIKEDEKIIKVGKIMSFSTKNHYRPKQ